MKKKVHVYYHVCLINDGIIIAIEQMHLMAISGLIKNAESINIGVKFDKNIPDNLNHFLKIVDAYNIKNNIKILYCEENFSKPDGEMPTISYLKQFSESCTDDAYLLYVHTKGVSRYGTKMEVPVRYWRNFMEYYTISNWKECYNILNQGYESCGSSMCNMSYMDRCNSINFHNTIARIEANHNKDKHYYPGSFYWINTSLIKRIPDKYFTINSEYRLHAGEALPGIISHKQYCFSDIDLEKIDPYETIINPQFVKF